MNLPNKLTTLRMILIPFFIAAYFISFKCHYFVALGIFALASFTDFLDGHLARKLHLVTDFGKFLDPVADKVLVISALTVLLADPYPAHAFAYFGDLSLMLCGVGVVIIVARELMISSLRMMAAKKGIVLAAEMIGKVKTFFTDIALVVILCGQGILDLNAKWGEWVIIVGLIMFAVSVILTVWSGIAYLAKNRGVIESR